jgi:C4-dicarboxylate-specific signal transduction histidine kinase
VVSFQDISAEVHAQARLREQQELLTHASRLSAVGELAGAIAHEINTPLASISLLIEAIRNALGPAPDEKISDDLAMVVRLIERIAGIVRAVRKLCRNTANDPFVSVPISQIFEDVEDICVERLRAQGIGLSLLNEIEGDQQVECRVIEVEQVLLNLINNAADAVSKCEKRWIELGARIEDYWLILTVSDSGPGIAGEVARKIFTPFYSTKAQGQGSGIGLSISRRILEAHGGTLELNRAHKCTQFVAKFPLSQAFAKPAA